MPITIRPWLVATRPFARATGSADAGISPSRMEWSWRCRGGDPPSGGNPGEPGRLLIAAGGCGRHLESLGEPVVRLVRTDLVDEPAHCGIGVDDEQFDAEHVREMGKGLGADGCAQDGVVGGAGRQPRLG